MDNGNWCLIESDPGVFTELIRAYGAKGLQVEEVWDLETGLHNLSPVYGAIFLFKWIKSHQDSASNANPQTYTNQTITSNVASDHVFFAKQIINNACATQAILSVLMNMDWHSNPNDIQLGSELDDFRLFTAEFNPEFKGLAITNSDTMRTVHNSFARLDSFVMENTTDDDSKSEDLFHFIAYVPVGGVVYELDGLKSNPIAVGAYTLDANNKNDAWIDTLVPAIQHRIARYKSSEIHFNLMAIIKDRTLVAQQELAVINTKITDLENQLQKSPDLVTIRDQLVSQRIEHLNRIQLETAKHDRYMKDNIRRRHNFIPLIYELLKQMAGTKEWNGIISQAEEKAREREAKEKKSKRK